MRSKKQQLQLTAQSWAPQLAFFALARAPLPHWLGSRTHVKMRLLLPLVAVERALQGKYYERTRELQASALNWLPCPGQGPSQDSLVAGPQGKQCRCNQYQSSAPRPWCE